jgi:hypothetical protein
MQNINQPIAILLLLGSLSIAQDSFIDKNKINKSCMKGKTKSKSNKGDKNSLYLIINNKKEFKKAYHEKKLNPEFNTKGDKHIVIDIKNVHLTRKDLKDLKEMKIESKINSSGDVGQIININTSSFNTDKPIQIGTRISADKIGSITSIVDITNSRLGKER